MDGDLSLSQSLGGLRIANPDDGSPELGRAAASSGNPLTSPSEHTPESHPPTTSPTSKKLPLPSPISPLDRSTENPYVLPNASLTTSNSNQPRPKPADSYPPRNAARPGLPFTYQDQQQAQFPQYPTMMPQNLHNPQTNASRQVPSYFTYPPVNGSSPSTPRDPNYRFSSEPAKAPGPNLPSRSNSRGGNAALQAGVPTRDNSHSERTYGRGGFTAGNGPVPPRRASRGMANGHYMNGVAGHGPMPATPTSLAQTHSNDNVPTSIADPIRNPPTSDNSGQLASKASKKGVRDFKFSTTLGEGSYSTVLLATDRQTLKEYAIKVLDKRHIIKEKKVKYVNIERDTLNRLVDHPGVVRLWYTFQDERSLYFVLDLCTGGELLGILKKMKTFNEECTRFYGAQILDTIEFMHRKDVIHRDLKPENVLLDNQMHVKITDFGTAKLLNPPKEPSNGLPLGPDGDDDTNRANSFVGTAEYVSPELLTDKSACKASDLWAFGCIIYQLLAGRPPFKASNEYQTFQKIVALNYEFPKGFPPVAQDLVERLLVLDPAQRLPVEHIKNHEFFDGISWGPGLWHQKSPRFQSYTPSSDPISLNPPRTGDPIASHSTHPTILPPANPTTNVRPQPTVITQLPPPSQLDLEWSPVLTRNNERILKMGDLLVAVSAASHSPHNGDGSKLSRLFGGNGAKKRPRMVMVTSSARIILAPPGGDEKKSKSEISLLNAGTEMSSVTDVKGITSWIVDTVSCIVLVGTQFTNDT